MKAKLNGIIGIDNAMERKLGSVDSTKKFIEATRTTKGRESLSQNTGISVHDITYWATQAELLRVNNMNAEEAVELIDAGIYSIEQLQKANKEELLNTIDKKNEARKVKTVLTEKKLSELQHEKVYDTTPYEFNDVGSILYPDKKEQPNIIVQEQPNLSQQVSRSVAKGIIDKYNKEDERKIDEGIKYLENIKPTLPLPKTISGCVKLKSNNPTTSNGGLLVSISGISNPALDKEENEKDYSCYTDPDGNFSIVMPDKYNMQEVITLSVSKKNDITYAIAGQSSSHKVEFVKQASEILKNEYFLTSSGKKKASEILSIINRVCDNNSKAKEIERTLYKLAYCEYAQGEYEQNRKEVEEAIKLYKDIISEEVEYHIKNADIDIEKLKIQYNEELDTICKAIDETLNQDKVVIGCLALLLALTSSSTTNTSTRSLKSATSTATNASANVETTASTFRKLTLHAKKFDTQTSSLDPSKKRVVDRVKKVIFNIDEQSKVLDEQIKVQTAETTVRSASSLSVEKQIIRTEPISADNITTDKETLLKEITKLAEDLGAIQDEFIKKTADFSPYEKIYYYEKDFLPKYAALIKKFMRTIDEYSLKTTGEPTSDTYNELGKGICDTLEELGDNCDLSAYIRIKALSDNIDKTRKLWKFLIQGVNPDENIEAEHLYHETCNDPYEDIAKMLPADCGLLKEKIADYVSAKNALQKIDDGLNYIEEIKNEFAKNNSDDSYFVKYINKLDGKPENPNVLAKDDYAIQIYAEYKDLIKTCKEGLDELDCLNSIIANKNSDESPEKHSDLTTIENAAQIERYILNFLSTPMDSKFEDAFTISETDFEDSDLHPRALPSVKLMGDEKNEVYLPTDTAPSRMYNYTMVHRLVEPKIKKNKTTSSRSKLNHALRIQEFKENLCNNPENITQANTLGIGYSLNMHQAWVPDGFALGNLLYSLILAPGEEQRLIVREHKEDYTVSDDSNAFDVIHDSYSNSQVDNETAAFNNAVDRYSSAHSDSSYYSKATSSGKSRIGFFFGIGASSSATSTNSGSSSANSSQRDSYDEASYAAQSFQTNIKTESERIASANRTSIRVATSEESEAVSSRIIANHNHSHVMTVQYWEVARRYRLETCIDGVELLLFVPLELVRFMPIDNGSIFSKYALQLTQKTLKDYDKAQFEYRYSNILKYYDTIQRYVPRKYRSGLNLIKKFAALPFWDVQQVSEECDTYTLTVHGGFCEFDNLSATIYFSNGNKAVQGILTSFNPEKLKRDEKKSEEEDELKDPHTRKEVIQAIISARNKDASATFKFTLPYGSDKEDISQIRIYNNIKTWKYTLSQDTDDMEIWEKKAVENYETRLKLLFQDNSCSGYDQRQIAHYAPGLPECYYNPTVTFSSSELHSLGDIDIKLEEDDSKVIGTGTLGYNTLYITRSGNKPRLRLTDIQKIEETFHHIVSDTMYYSQVVWSSLSDNERIMLLEPYTIEIDNLDRISSSDGNTLNNYNKTKSISLLNCVNAKKVIGFYGNCMMLPFTFPKELAELLGKTAGDIQDELYRYHACNFRVPSTTISVPTDGMVGEAVLGATNVSEKIDITRFWNWKDSDIDHIDLSQSSLNGRSLLENADTKDVNAPTVGVTPTEHVNGNNLAAALIARQQPTFADVYQNTDMRDVMKNADNNASAGREQIIKANTELTKAALDAAVKAGSAALTGGMSGALGGSSNPISGILGALGDAGLGNTELGKLLKDGVGENGSLSGIAKSLVGMINGDSSALTDALKSFGGEKLKSFLSNFASEAMDGKTLEESFKKSLSSITGTDKNVTVNDILNMSKQFCSENGIQLDSFTSALASILGIL